MKNNNVIYSIIWLFIAIILSIFTTSNSNLYTHLLLVLANIYSYYRCIRIWGSNGNNYLSLYTFFILYMCASNLGQSIVSIIPSSMNELSIYEEFNIDEIISALRFQLLCVSCIGLGTSLYIGKNSVTTNELISHFNNTSSQSFKSQRFIKFLFWGSICLVLIDAASYFLLRQTMGYLDAYNERQLGGIPFYMQLSNWLVILLSFYFIFTKRYIKQILFIFIFLILLFLSCGNRALTIKYLGFLFILYPIIYPKYFQKKFIIIWIIIGIFFFALLSTVSSIRNDVGTSLQLANGQMTISELFLESLAEMGGSVNTLIYTMDAIESGVRHHLTELYFIITATTTSKLSDFLGLSNEYLPLSEWVGEYAGIRNYGLGYSCLAEWFMNYGWYGCIYAGLYGYIITMAECISYKKIIKGEYLISAVLLTFLCSQIFYARSTLFYSLFDVRFGIWLILASKLLKNKNR